MPGKLMNERGGVNIITQLTLEIRILGANKKNGKIVRQDYLAM
jgi:hypothetical protein